MESGRRKRVGSTAFLHQNFKGRHKEKIEESKTVITQENVTNGEVRSSPSRAFSLLALFFSCALVRRGYTVELLHVSCSLFSSMSTRKFEGRREKGIEGMSWGNDNEGAINCS